MSSKTRSDSSLHNLNDTQIIFQYGKSYWAACCWKKQQWDVSGEFQSAESRIWQVSDFTFVVCNVVLDPDSMLTIRIKLRIFLLLQNMCFEIISWMSRTWEHFSLFKISDSFLKTRSFRMRLLKQNKWKVSHLLIWNSSWWNLSKNLKWKMVLFHHTKIRFDISTPLKSFSILFINELLLVPFIRRHCSWKILAWNNLRIKNCFDRKSFGTNSQFAWQSSNWSFFYS